MRFCAMTYDACGRLQPFRGPSGAEITFDAPDLDAAHELARAHKLPEHVLLLADELLDKRGDA